MSISDIAWHCINNEVLCLQFSKILLSCFKFLFYLEFLLQISILFRISKLFQYLMYILAKFNTFSRSWKPILKFNTVLILRGNPVLCICLNICVLIILFLFPYCLLGLPLALVKLVTWIFCLILSPFFGICFEVPSTYCMYIYLISKLLHFVTSVSSSLEMYSFTNLIRWSLLLHAAILFWCRKKRQWLQIFLWILLFETSFDRHL